MSSNDLRRVAVTGMGIIASIGEGLPAFRKSLFDGQCGIGPVSLFDTAGFASRNAAEVKKRNIEDSVDFRRIRRISRCDILGLIAARESLLDTGLDFDALEGGRAGVVLGGGAGGMLSWERYRRALYSKGENSRPSPLLASSPSNLTDLIAGCYGFTGYRGTITTACSSSATAIGYGSDLIRSGDQDIVITGGSESLCELTFAGFAALRVMDTDFCRPFDIRRRGLSLGEGAAMLVLEEYESALQRGAKIYAEVLGYATNSDAFHMTSPDPEAGGMSRVMMKAMEYAKVKRKDVGYINAHGTGTKANDKTETLAIKRVFGEERAVRIPVSSTKSLLGHCLGAAGAIEAVATILALTEQTCPPTIHLEEPDPDCDLFYVPDVPLKSDIPVAISNSFAFGGNNTSIVFRQ